MTSGKPKTFYIPSSAEKDWLHYQELCDAKLNLSASKRINTLWLQDLCSLEGRDNSSLSCSLEDKISEKIAVEKKENQTKDFLERNILCNRRSAFESLAILAERLGTNRTFDKDLPSVRQRLIEYTITPKDYFSRSDRQMFIIYLDYVVKRRLLENEIDNYLLSNDASAQTISTPITFEEIATPS